METIETYLNINDGIKAIIMTGNDRFKYRVVVRDIDADETITIRFCDEYSRCLEYAKTFFIDGYTLGE